jgi:hypothetical protein
MKHRTLYDLSRHNTQVNRQPTDCFYFSAVGCHHRANDKQAQTTERNYGRRFPQSNLRHRTPPRIASA